MLLEDEAERLRNYYHTYPKRLSVEDQIRQALRGHNRDNALVTR